jgi:RNA polymerase sigma-70 factor (ECF subfamily)
MGLATSPAVGSLQRVDFRGVDGQDAAVRSSNADLVRASRHPHLEIDEKLVAELYPELRRRAAAYLRRERRGHTLQPTALVNEAYLRLLRQREISCQNRTHVVALAAQMMRRILVDHARRRNMGKRSGRWARVTLHDHAARGAGREIDVLALDEALSRLEEFDAQKSHVVELRYFAGLSIDETAAALAISPATVDREWRAARAWLQTQLTHGS